VLRRREKKGEKERPAARGKRERETKGSTRAGFPLIIISVALGKKNPPAEGEREKKGGEGRGPSSGRRDFYYHSRLPGAFMALASEKGKKKTNNRGGGKESTHQAPLAVSVVCVSAWGGEKGKELREGKEGGKWPA